MTVVHDPLTMLTHMAEQPDKVWLLRAPVESEASRLLGTTQNQIYGRCAAHAPTLNPRQFEIGVEVSVADRMLCLICHADRTHRPEVRIFSNG